MPERVAYGPTDIEKVDIYRTKRANAPTMIFIHGGAWRSGRSANFALYAEVFVKAGANFVAVDFNNVIETKGDLFPMVNQCRRAVAWVYRNAATFGANADETYLCGRSSGSHLAGCVVITEWEKLGLPRDILKGAVLGSGMYDLKPVRLSKRGNYVKFTDEMEQALSAQRHIDNIKYPYPARSHSRHAGDARVSTPDARLCGGARGCRKAGPVHRRQGLQSLRDGRDPGQSLRHHGPRRARNDEADDRLTVRIRAGMNPRRPR
jgi:acetyl esterase/lipase